MSPMAGTPHPHGHPGPAWSPAALSVWGKTDRDTGEWFPVVHHLTDTALMAGELFDWYLPEGTKASLVSLTGLPLEQVRTLATFLAGVHDIGKVSVQFTHQATHRFPELLSRMRDHGLDASRPWPERIGHATLGQVILTDWLRRRHGAAPRPIRGHGAVVGGHHGRNPSPSDLLNARQRPDALGSGAWGEVRDEILDGMAAFTGADAHWSDWVARPLPAAAQSLLTGLVIMADWMASNKDYFPYRTDLSPEARLDHAASLLDLPPSWRPKPGDPDVGTLFHDRFPHLSKHSARPIQRALVEAARAATDPPLLIVEAPMGVGKTEAALLAAEVLASRFGQGGVFLGLPTMATANPMFTRTLQWLDAALDEDASVALVHGKAGLNDEYAGLVHDAWQGVLHDEDSDEAAHAVVNMWLRGPKRAGLSSFVIGTVDQALFAALKAKHVALRHLGLANKVVVLDEVHSADVYMRHYLHRLLAWLAALRVPVILMSATLPPTQRQGFIEAYASGAGDRHPAPPDPGDTYPRITAHDGGTRTMPVDPGDSTATVAVERLGDEPEATASLLAALLAEGGCAGVICNTVGRAQTMYDTLRDRFGSDEVILLHSRFIAPERLAREAAVIAHLGSNASSRPHRLIVVGTQVLEQSLDIDFDVMVSDLAPIDLILQRVGRLHRHRRDNRPPAVATPRLHLRGMTDWGATPPEPARSTVSIYGRAAVLRSAAVLAGMDAITLPHDIPTLVRRGYDPAFLPPAGWESVWQAAERVEAESDARRLARAASFLLPSPLGLSTLDGWIDVDSGDPDRAEQEGRAQVRDSEDSVEVIVVERIGETLRLPGSATMPHAPVPQGQPWGTGSDTPVARAMAACTIRLPRELSHEGVIEPVVEAIEKMVDASGWQDSPWLRGQLVLPLDEHGNATIRLRVGQARQNVRYDLHYDSERGLNVERAEEGQWSAPHSI